MFRQLFRCGSVVLPRHSNAFTFQPSACNVSTVASEIFEAYMTVDRKVFDKYFPVLMEKVLDFPKIIPDHPSLKEFVKEVLQYNTTRGKKARGRTLVRSYIECAGDHLNYPTLEKAVIVGWCNEIMQGSFVIVDDFQDKSTLRRGVPCWHTLRGYEEGAIAHGYLLYSLLFHVLTSFKDEEWCEGIMRLFHKCGHLSALGARMSHSRRLPDGRPDFTVLTPEHHRKVIIRKSMHYTFELPIVSGMHIGDVRDPDVLSAVTKILEEIDMVFQINDDYLDIYGDPKMTGKAAGQDIREAMPNWFIGQALSLADENQLKVLESNLGVATDESAAKVMDIFGELELENRYTKFQRQKHVEVENLIQDAPRGTPAKTLLKLLEENKFRIFKIGVGMVVVGGFLSSAIFNVDGGQRAIIFDRIHGLQNKIIGEGTHLILPWLQKPIIFDVRSQPKTVPVVTGSKDLQNVQTTLRVLFRPLSDRLPEIYSTLGSDYGNRVLPSITSEVLKSVVAQFDASDLITKRELVSERIAELLEKRAAHFGIVFDDISLTHLSFGREFTNAVEQKQVAQQEAESARFLVEKAEFLKTAAIVAAEGDAIAAKLIADALNSAGEGLVELRRIETCEEIALELSHAANVTYLPVLPLLIGKI